MLWLVPAYLVGSIPFGCLIGWARGMDIRSVGSGNIGATNVGRFMGRRWGLICFSLDFLKGFGPSFSYGLASSATVESDGAISAIRWLGVTVAAVLGHVFPLWLHFKGGKGVATGLGALLGVWPVLGHPAVFALVIWLVVVGFSGYVSLASIISATALPILVGFNVRHLDRPLGECVAYILAMLLLAVLVVLRHGSNMARLRAGTEKKISLWNSNRDRIGSET